jgi:hypothetical protein
MEPALGEELERMFSELDQSATPHITHGVGTGLSELHSCTVLVAAMVGIVVVLAVALAMRS